MRSAALLTAALLAASAALVAGCGSEDAVSGSSAASGSPMCTPRPLTGDPADLKRDGVRIVRLGCRPSPGAAIDFEVTNTETEPFTYTLTFELRKPSGEVTSSPSRTVVAVAPGRTVRDTVELGEVPDAGADPRVRIAKVRAVPADEASADSAKCPPSGMRVTTDKGDAAMGLRVVGLHLTNCGTGVVRTSGYPRLQLLDEKRRPIAGVRILDGTGAISTAGGPDVPPRPVTLKPGETAYASLMWRNTTESGDPVNVPYVRVTVNPGSPAAIVTPELDLGTTGRLGVGPWTKDTEKASRPAGPDDYPAPRPSRTARSTGE
ncbi:hypothetical protein A8W25_19625 [Streptomyces sp. ERV7]|uniref:DUF4232 domain-containing protein n=1 Tax=Streptomyces sp. ERV7 TaxID=1322334 RepID=UPI0007F51D08|nr:DUF4232 domain-containing protein [Streptomyces sp. ERV7]OAR24592.1 hypothetical protein A8W25_19625 [Streptomyces sp. ERV7]